MLEVFKQISVNVLKIGRKLIKTRQLLKKKKEILILIPFRYNKDVSVYDRSL